MSSTTAEPVRRPPARAPAESRTGHAYLLIAPAVVRCWASSSTRCSASSTTACRTTTSPGPATTGSPASTTSGHCWPTTRCSGGACASAPSGSSWRSGCSFVFGLALALMLNQTFVGRGLARALVFRPWAVSGVLTSDDLDPALQPHHRRRALPRRHGHRRVRDLPAVGPGTPSGRPILAELWRASRSSPSSSSPTCSRCRKELYEAASRRRRAAAAGSRHITWPHIRKAVIICHAAARRCGSSTTSTCSTR